jgi:hypothetical protein
MPRIELTEVERLALSKAGAQSISCNNGWRPWSTVPENTWVLVSFYWKKGKEWYEEGKEWDVGIGRTHDRTELLVDVLHLDLREMDAVWQPLPQPPQDEPK